MATTGAVLYVRPSVAAANLSRFTGAMLFVAVRESTGQFTSVGTIPKQRNLRNLKAIKPHRSVPMTDKSGNIVDAWDNYFSYLNDTFLSMSNGPTLPDVANSITYSQAQSLISEGIAAALTQQANANAQSIQTIREVVVSAALPGSAQIPAPKLYSGYQPTGGAPSEPGGGGE